MALLAALAEAAAYGAEIGGCPLAALQLVQLMQLSSPSATTTGRTLALTGSHARNDLAQTLDRGTAEQASNSGVQHELCREVGSRAVEAWTARLAAAGLAYFIPGLWEGGLASSALTSWREEAVAQLQVLTAAGIDVREKQ